MTAGYVGMGRVRGMEEGLYGRGVMCCKCNVCMCGIDSIAFLVRFLSIVVQFFFNFG